MYDELIKALYEGAEFLECSTPGIKNSFAKMCHNAADAIEELSKVVKHQAEILHRYGGETGIRQSAEMNDSLLRLLQAQPRWIPVTERLPDYDEVVQITDGIDVGHGYLEGVNTTVGIALLWHSPFCDIDEEHITHWMPLPEPPKEEQS